MPGNSSHIGIFPDKSKNISHLFAAQKSAYLRLFDERIKRYSKEYDEKLASNHQILIKKTESITDKVNKALIKTDKLIEKVDKSVRESDEIMRRSYKAIKKSDKVMRRSDEVMRRADDCLKTKYIPRENVVLKFFRKTIEFILSLLGLNEISPVKNEVNDTPPPNIYEPLRNISETSFLKQNSLWHKSSPQVEKTKNEKQAENRNMQIH